MWILAVCQTNHEIMRAKLLTLAVWLMLALSTQQPKWPPKKLEHTHTHEAFGAEMFCTVRVKPDCFRVRKQRGYKHLDAWLGSLAVAAGFSEHVRQALSSPWAMSRPRRVVRAAGTNTAVNVSGMRFPPRTWADLCVRDISQPWSTRPAGEHRTAWCSAFLPYEVMNALSSIILYERKWSWNKSVSAGVTVSDVFLLF